MAKVRPSQSIHERRRRACVTFVAAFYRRAKNQWQRLQIGHRERYSVERVLALRDYCARVSAVRVFFVLLLTPLPAFLVAILIECIPLRPPSDGWRANYAFWIRLFLSCFPMAVAGVLQVRQVVAPGVISNVATVGVGVGTALGYVACVVSLAALWHFPVPFGYVLMVGPFVLFFMGSLGLVVGWEMMSKPPILPQLAVLVAQGVLAGCYPPFFAVFNQLSGPQQTAFVLVLPLIKLLSKQYIAKVCGHLQEYIGPTVVFSVDVCNVLYTVICMQTAVSSLTTVFMISSDLFFILMALRAIYYQTTSASVRPESTLLSSKLTKQRNYLHVLPELVQQAFQNDESAARFVRVSALFPLHLSDSSKELISELTKDVTPQVSGRTSAMAVAFERQRGPSLPDLRQYRHPSMNAVMTIDQTPPVVQSWLLRTPTSRSSSSRRVLQSSRSPSKLNGATRGLSVLARSATRRVLSSVLTRRRDRKSAAQEVQDALQALFHSEFVLMSEYVEFVLPIFYAVYVAVLHSLPTAAYYPHMRSMTTDKLRVTLRNLVFYSCVEFASFAVLAVLLKRKFGFSPLYQLAFVLETQGRTLQGQLFVWVLCIMQLMLVHHGVDLTAPFKNK